MRADRQTHRQTYRHTDHNTPRICWGEVGLKYVTS